MYMNECNGRGEHLYILLGTHHPCVASKFLEQQILSHVSFVQTVFSHFFKSQSKSKHKQTFFTNIIRLRKRWTVTPAKNSSVCPTFFSRSHDILSRAHDILSRAHVKVSRAHVKVSRAHVKVSRAHVKVSRAHVKHFLFPRESLYVPTGKQVYKRHSVTQCFSTRSDQDKFMITCN